MNTSRQDPLEEHPYKIFEVPKPRLFIIGTFPIGQFTNPERKNEILPNEVEFFYGGCKNLLWKTLSKLYLVDLNTKEKRERFLFEKSFSMADAIEICRRKNGSSSDRDLYDQKWNKSLKQVLIDAGIPKVIFTSDQAKDWFKEHIFPEFSGKFEVVPTSGHAPRLLPRRLDYQEWKRKNPEAKPAEFLLVLYKKAFVDEGIPL